LSLLHQEDLAACYQVKDLKQKYIRELS